MVSRRLAWLAIALVAALAAVQAKQVGDDRLKAEALATCWDCHKVVQNDCAPLQTFVALLPGDGVGAAPGEAFDFTVQAQNAWCSDLYAVRVNLDLANAPSLGFASGVPEVKETHHGTIVLDPARAAEPQRSPPVEVEVPAGETQMTVTLRPPAGAAGSDLALVVYPPGFSSPLRTVDEGGQGVPETFAVPDRAQFAEWGYGRWTFHAEARMLPAPDGGPVVPSPDGTVPFELQVEASADASDARLGSAMAAASPSQPLKEAGSAAVTFRLVALGTPAEGESLTLAADVWPHYTHKGTNPNEDDDENVTKVHPTPVPVLAEAGRVIVRSGPGGDIVVPRPVNGPTLQTVSEAVGYSTALLLVSSITTGGMFGKASRRGLNHLFGTAKRRVAFHNFLSYGIVLAAGVHTTLFVVEAAYHWTLGLIWGGAAVLALLGLGVTGAVQVPLIRGWGYGGWRWTHYALALAAIAFTVVHVLLDGAHFADLQGRLGWEDPLQSHLG